MAKYFVTTAIPYPNGKPHIGFGFEVLLADVLARFHRVLNDEVKLLTGTDEHGLKVFQTAQKEGIGFQEFVDRNSKEFQNLKDVLSFSYDDFIKTTDQKRHWPGAQKLWEECFKAGAIYKKTYEGLYCVGCEEFKNEKDLVEGLCPEHKTKPEVVAEENYFFKLTDFTDRIRQKIESGEFLITPVSRKNEVLSILKDAEDFSVSRPSKRISWGIPVPNDPSQTIYVWFDALINYISAIGYGRDEESFNKWWPADVHVIGKGISRFHAIFWPAMLMAANLPLPKGLLIHGYINIGGEKISKSLGNVISPRDVIEKYGKSFRDPLRYYLLRYIPTTEDGDFSYEQLEEAYTADLANGLGNLVARVAKLCEKSGFEASEKVNHFDPEVERLISEFKFNEALAWIWKIIQKADQRVNETQPWKLEGLELKEVLDELVSLIIDVAFNLQPFMPETSEKILKQFSGKVVSQAPLFPRV